MNASAETASSSSRYSIAIFMFLSSRYSASNCRIPAHHRLQEWGKASTSASRRSSPCDPLPAATCTCRRSALTQNFDPMFSKLAPESRSMPARIWAARVYSSSRSCSAASASRITVTCSSNDTTRGCMRSRALRTGHRLVQSASQSGRAGVSCLQGSAGYAQAEGQQPAAASRRRQAAGRDAN